MKTEHQSKGILFRDDMEAAAGKSPDRVLQIVPTCHLSQSVLLGFDRDGGSLFACCPVCGQPVVAVYSQPKPN